MLDGSGGHQVRRLSLDRLPPAPEQAPAQAGAGVDASWQQLRRFLTGFLIVVVAAAAAWPFLPRRYESLATIVLRSAELNASGEHVVHLRQPLDDNAVQSEIDMLTSPTLASAVIARQGLMQDPEFGHSWWQFWNAKPPTEADVRRNLQARFNVARDRRSYTVHLGYRSADPQKAAALAETLLAAYIESQLARKRAALLGQSSWLEERTKLLRAKLDNSEHAIKGFLLTTGLMDGGGQLSLEKQLDTLSTEYAQTRIRSEEMQTRALALAAMKEAGTLETAPEVLASASILRLKDNLNAAITKPIVWNSEVAAIEARIAAEASRIVQSMEAEARFAASRTEVLRKNMDAIRADLTRLRSDELRLEQLRREAATDKAVLDETVTRLAGLAGGVRADIEILARPEIPLSPVTPSRLLVALGTLIAACLAGALLAWGYLGAEFLTRLKKWLL